MAMRRARGGRSFTTLPPMSTLPSVGRSRPAIRRSKVVLPEPDGPSSTRYSPSLVRRSTPSTAGLSPTKTLRTPLVSTTAISRLLVSGVAADQSLLAPLLEDRLDPGLRLGHGLLGR